MPNPVMEEFLSMAPPVKGFIDLQVNGFLGIDFSAPGLDLEQVRTVVFALRERGTVSFCPTVITAPMDVYEQNLPILARAMSEPDLAPHLLGIHLEGPFISPRDGARGAHPAQHTQLPSIPTFERLQKLAAGHVSLVTLAPELPGAEELIRYVRSSGSTVSLGHHLADYAAIARACDNGAVASTHLGNGIPNHLPRHPNPLWDQLDEQRLTAMLIVDGHHVPGSFVRVVVRLKTSRRVIVVSDAAPIAGLPPGNYETLGQEVILEPSGRIWNPRGNHLVGSSACMMDCMNHLASLNVLSEAELWQVGYHNPLELIRKKLDSLQFANLPDLSFRNDKFERGRASQTGFLVEP